MKKEEKEETFLQRLLKAKMEIGKVYRNAENKHLKSKYADLNSILDTCEPVLLKHGILIMQPIVDGMVFTRLVDVETKDTLESWISIPEIANPQQLGSAISYFRRYTLSSLLSISTTDDDDGSGASKAIPKKTIASDDLVKRFAKSLAEGTAKWSVEKFKENYELTEEQLKSIEI